jgi:hypothetical protein
MASQLSLIHSLFLGLSLALWIEAFGFSSTKLCHGLAFKTKRLRPQSPPLDFISVPMALLYDDSNHAGSPLQALNGVDHAGQWAFSSQVGRGNTVSSTSYPILPHPTTIKDFFGRLLFPSQSTHLKH